ncbi:hypothetical protein QT971_30865 [Microcoleus sp. herbarium19]|uniref:hypothetical protein n=1 Tax=unclassified Microcoleus TaxID=2642155 RepID=UPI002FD07FF9
MFSSKVRSARPALMADGLFHRRSAKVKQEAETAAPTAVMDGFIQAQQQQQGISS